MTDAVGAGPIHAAFVVVGGPQAPWADAGLTVAPGGWVRLHGPDLRLDPDQQPGVAGWAFAAPDIDGRPPDIDGLPTLWLDTDGLDTDGLDTDGLDSADEATPAHPLTTTSIDHLVIDTDSLERTCAAITSATGAELKRVRELGVARQGFHRLDTFVVEVVERAHRGDRADDPPGARFWGLTLTVADLDAAVRFLGPERVSAAKDAVQPGRRIATVRRAAGLGLPVALMSPRPSRSQADQPRPA